MPNENVERIPAAEARRRSQSGQALLVCAYDDEEKCRDLALQGSISLAELREKEVDRDREIVFYCA